MPDPCTDPQCPHRVTDPPIPHFHTQTPGDGFTDLFGTDLANRLVSALRITDADTDSELPPVSLCDDESCPLTAYYGVVHTHLGSLQPTLLRGDSNPAPSEQDSDLRPTHPSHAVSGECLTSPHGPCEPKLSYTCAHCDRHLESPAVARVFILRARELVRDHLNWSQDRGPHPHAENYRHALSDLVSLFDVKE